ncbi:hypothetical protein [Halorhodospira abdelmalekii]|uniref:hypothetical protein n=1 Tax=Halorhodospira abdelmalekii TaxID=421629 RepID=UPI001903A7C5|nr:hypothetical protein [Halorhodospira abdelmalekii]
MAAKADRSRGTHGATGKALVLAVFCGVATQVGQVAAESDCTPEHIARMIQNELPDDVIREVCADAGVDLDAVVPALAPAEEVREERQYDGERVLSEQDEESRRTFFGVGLYGFRSQVHFSGEREKSDYIGLQLLLGRAFHRRWSGDFGYYFLKNESDSAGGRVSGFDSTLWLSTNAYHPGWNFGLGVGFYTESWEKSSFSGVQYGFLIGHRGEKTGFEFKAKARSTGDQESEISNASDVRHTTRSLNFVYQF